MTVSCSIQGIPITLKDIYNIPLKSDIITSVCRTVKKEVEAIRSVRVNGKNGTVA